MKKKTKSNYLFLKATFSYTFEIVKKTAKIYSIINSSIKTQSFWYFIFTIDRFKTLFSFIVSKFNLYRLSEP